MTKLKYVVLALALTMVGCTTVPLATQARLATVSRQSLQETLRLLQREDLAKRKRRGLTLNVESQVSTVPDGASSVRIWVDLRLKQPDSYITLFDGVEVNF